MDKYCKESNTIKSSNIFPSDTNNHGTMFGGKLMSDIDDVAGMAAVRHARKPCVTASTDSVDFLQPITKDECVILEAFVTGTGRSSMEVFVKVIAENLLSGERKIAATSFLTFVAFDPDKKQVVVPGIIPETEEEKKLCETYHKRNEMRKIHREQSKELALFLKKE